MKAEEFLKNYSQQATPLFKKLFQKLENKAARTSSINQDMIRALRKFAQGGKHVRGTLVVLGYQCAGQEKSQDIFEVAIAVDLLHSALLIADDIMDQDDLRRGRPTLHRFCETTLAPKYQRFEPYHFGISMGLNLSLLTAFFAEEIFARADFEPQKLQMALAFLNSYLVKTLFGQGIDITRQGNLLTTIEEVFTIHRFKTAYYTISGPLQVGGILGGAPQSQLAAMSAYGEKVGVAFQLRDDELGIFGDERTLGKKVNSDLKEGKNTVLFIKAFQEASSKERKALLTSFGNPRVSKAQLVRVREIIIKTGALKYSQKLSQKLVNEGKFYIPKITLEERRQKILYNLADFMVKREK